MGLSFYARWITTELGLLGQEALDPALVEAWMRLEHSTLDHLSAETFRMEVAFAVACIQADPDGSLNLARSFGLARDCAREVSLPCTTS